MDSDATNPYDRLAYLNHAYPQTHPDRLATISTLHGMKPAPVQRCRVLEIGCGDATNLLSAAYTLPESEFFGFDLATQPILQGREQAAALGLRNLRLETLDILEFPPDAGKFDYIIAHGVYSWVPPTVREALLALCERHLSQHGVAFISFNAYPGWHSFDLARQMMLYHLGRVWKGGTDEDRVRQALSLLRFVATFLKDEDPRKKILLTALETFVKPLNVPGGVAWFCHDILEEVNQPFYLHEFVRQAGTKSLQFLASGSLQAVQLEECPPPVMEALREMQDDPVAQEQYRDFIDGTSFRQVLLCRAGVPLDRSLALSRIVGLYVRANLQPPQGAASADKDPQAPETFRFEDNEVTLKHPLGKAAVRSLRGVWPHGLAFGELLAAARAEAGGDAEESAAELGRTLLALYGAGLAHFSTVPPCSARQISERPEVSAVARAQIQRGSTVTTLQHLNAILPGPFNRRLLGLLDGTRTRADLLRELRVWIESGEADREGAAVVDASSELVPVPTLTELEHAVDQALELLAQKELLVR